MRKALWMALTMVTLAAGQEDGGDLEDRPNVRATGESVIQLMFELNREQGTTLVVVTHDQQVAARCERQIRIEAGRIAEG